MTTSHSPSALVADQVRFAYPLGPAVVDELTVTIQANRRHVILGSNGSGKSTLLLLLNGSLKPAGGRVLLGGEELRYDRRSRTAHRCRVGLVLQDPDDQLFSANVAEDVSFGPLNLGLSKTEARRRVETVLAELDLTSLADRPAHLLSYGQRKRVAIAGVAAMEPDIMLLDEPLAGLDPVSQAEVLETLDRLEAGGTTIAITTHDVDLALAWGQHATIMDSGRLIAEGPAIDVLGRAEVMHAARLRIPSVLSLSATLQQLRVLDPEKNPRSLDELRQLLTPIEPPSAAAS